MIKLSAKNYSQYIQEIDLSLLPEKLKEGYELVKFVTKEYTDWIYYKNDPEIREVVNAYFSALSKHINSDGPPKPAVSPVSKPSNSDAFEAAKSLIRVYVLRGDSMTILSKSSLGASNSNYSAEIRSDKITVTRIGNMKVSFTFPLKKVYDEILSEKAGADQPKPATGKGKVTKPKPVTAARPNPKPKPKPASLPPAQPVERISEEVKFIKRYALLHGKTKSDAQLLNFINALQRSIVEKRIRKASEYAKQIQYIQNSLLKVYNGMKPGTEKTLQLKPATLAEFQRIAGSVNVRLSVAYMKRYISLQGKLITKEKAERLHKLIADGLKAARIPADDPYLARTKTVLSSLRAFIQSARKGDTLTIHQTALNGISAALDGCGCGCRGKKCGSTLNGTDGPLPENAIINTVDFVKRKFHTLGFTGKWLELIGDPTSSFTAMIFGKPKMGKSYLSIEFANYLAQNHGKVLYIAKEEGLDFTLQEKLQLHKHVNLDATGTLPDSLDNYDFIFFDSVSRLGLTPDDLRELKRRYPEKSFIYIFQTTKQGNFRGENAFQHDVDVVVEVPEKGKAVQMGRFNQGGTMDIFPVAA